MSTLVMTEFKLIREAADLLATDLMEDPTSMSWVDRYTTALQYRLDKDLWVFDDWLKSLPYYRLIELVLGSPENQITIELAYNVPICSLTGERLTTVFADMI